MPAKWATSGLHAVHAAGNPKDASLKEQKSEAWAHQRLLVQWKNFVRSSKIGTRNPAYGCLTNPASSKQQTSNHTISQPAKKRALRESSMRNGYAALAASARSTRNAACQHAVSSHRGFAIQRIMWMHFSQSKKRIWRRWGLPGTQNRTAAANAFFPVHKSSSATSASEQLLELLLLKELSEAAAFSARLWHGVKPRFWARGTPPPIQRPHAPIPEAAENTPASKNCLSSSSSISTSSSCSEALVSCRKRFVKRKKCIRPCGSVLSPG